MYNPTPGWRPTSSYVEPVAVPAAGPGDDPLLCVSFSAPWRPYILGALQQLCQPTSWDTADPAALSAVLADVQALLSRIAAAGACEVLAFDCIAGVPSYSTDGGVSWHALPDCFTGPAGPAGPAGPTGGFSPGAVPPNPYGFAAASRACSIAGYLAEQVIKASINQAVTIINASGTIVEIAAGIIATIVELGPFAVPIAEGARLLFLAVSAGGLAAYNTALASSALWSDVTCAIYSATSATGYVTSGNLAAVLTALAGIAYADAGVVSTIHDYVAALGLEALQQAQNIGALALYDCSGCGLTEVALSFAGAGNTQVLLASDVTLGPGFTVGGWLRAFAVGNGYIVVGGRSGGSPQCWTIISASGVLSGYAFGASTDAQTSPTYAIHNGETHHVALVVAGSAMTLYVDGVARGTAALPPGPYNHAGGATGFGGAGSLVGPLGCVLWRWAQYDSALSAGAIAAWAAGGHFAAPPAGAAHVWLMGEGAGPTVHDSAVGPADDGTASGGYVWTAHT